MSDMNAEADLGTKTGAFTNSAVIEAVMGESDLGLDEVQETAKRHPMCIH